VSFDFLNECILVFESDNEANFIYNNIIRKGFSIQLVSKPCVISSPCTQCIKLREEYINMVKKESEKNDIKIKEIYKIIKNGYRNSYELISF
jgi:hypothetical protein